MFLSLRMLPLPSLAMILCGCAVHYYDPATGTAHLWGVGHMKMRVVRSEESPKVQAVAVGVETLGVRIDANQHTSGLTLGYDRASVVEIIESDTALRLDTANGDPFTLRLGTTFPQSEAQ